MISPTDVFALCGWALALSAAVLRLQHVRFARSSLAKLFLLAVFMVLLIPVFGAGLPIAAFFRGIGGDLSITLLALSSWGLAHRLSNATAINKRELTLLMAVISAAALLFYPTALGWGNWDAYRLGWGSWWFLSALLGLCIISVWRGFYVLPALMALALLAWSFGLMESGNLWDYLLDPWLCAVALSFVFIKCWQSAFKYFAHRSFR